MNVLKQELQKIIVELFGLKSWDEVRGQWRTYKISDARKAYSYVGRHELRLSYKEMGRDINKRHTSVIRAIKTTKVMYEVKDPVTVLIDDARRKLQAVMHRA